MSETKRWCSIKQAAEYFQIPRGTVYSLIGRGRLPAGAVLRLGRQIRINVEMIEQGAAVKGRKT